MSACALRIIALAALLPEVLAALSVFWGCALVEMPQDSCSFFKWLPLLVGVYDRFLS